MTVAAPTPERRAPRVGPEGFFERMLALAHEARRRSGDARSAWVRVGPALFELRFASASLADRVLPAFAHRTVAAETDAPRLIVELFDGCDGRLVLPPAPWSPADYDGRGEVKGFNDARWLTVLDVTGNGLRMLDRRTAHGVCFFPSAALVPPQGWTIPVVGLVAAMGRGREQVVHAAAVGTETGGVLVTGRSGSGKSTTTAACLTGGLRTAGDDLVLVAWEDAPVAHSLVSTMKLDPATLARFPELAELADGTETVGQEKRVLWLGRGARERLADRLPLRAILVPRVSGARDSRLVPASPADVLRDMAPSTLFVLPGAGAEGFRKMAELTRRLPCFRLECGNDLAQLPELVRGLVA